MSPSDASRELVRLAMLYLPEAGVRHAEDAARYSRHLVPRGVRLRFLGAVSLDVERIHAARRPEVAKALEHYRGTIEEALVGEMMARVLVAGAAMVGT